MEAVQHCKKKRRLRIKIDGKSRGDLNNNKILFFYVIGHH